MMDYFISSDFNLKDNVCQYFDTYQCFHTKEHSLQVVKESQKLAQKFHVDMDKCYQAALLHDISAVISPQKMMDIALSHQWEIDPAEKKYPFLLHQRISALIAQTVFKIEDQDILSAIACHTTLKKNASDIDMVVFLADKIKWDQKGEPPYLHVIQKGLDISLKKASYMFLDEQLKNQRILYPHQWLKEAYDDLKK